MLPTSDLLKSYNKTVDSQLLNRDDQKPFADIVEDVAVNNVGSSNIAGVGVGKDGEPGVRKKNSNKYKRANELDNTNLLRRVTLKEDHTKVFKVGVVGYSSGKFDTVLAEKYIKEGLAKIQSKSSKHISEIVSGLTNVGIPALAYKYAKAHNITTVGIACKLASQHLCFPVTKEIIVGNKWGDESQSFIDYVDAILRIGGGDQSLAEVKKFKQDNPTGIVVEYELERE